jgi:hypothetical protein
LNSDLSHSSHARAATSQARRWPEVAGAWDGSLGANHCRPQCAEGVSSSRGPVRGKPTRFFCSIRCRRQLACDRRCAYRSRPVVRPRYHLAIDDAASAMELLTRMDRRHLAEGIHARTMREVEAYLFERSRVYSSERRFKDDAYWSAVSRSSMYLTDIGLLPAGVGCAPGTSELNLSQERNSTVP